VIFRAYILRLLTFPGDKLRICCRLIGLKTIFDSQFLVRTPSVRISDCKAINESPLNS